MADIIAMVLFSFIMSITPGPVNLITLNSGLNYGFRRTIPYVSGATIGFTLLLVTLGMGLSSVVMEYPKVLRYTSYLGIAYMVYMGYAIMKSSPVIHSERPPEHPPRFIDGAILQCTNPKAWMACLSGLTAFTSAASMTLLAKFSSIYFVICYCCIGTWAFAGMKLRVLLTKVSYVQCFNRVMGLLLIVTSLYLATSIF